MNGGEHSINVTAVRLSTTVTACVVMARNPRSQSLSCAAMGKEPEQITGFVAEADWGRQLSEPRATPDDSAQPQPAQPVQPTPKPKPPVQPAPSPSPVQATSPTDHSRLLAQTVVSSFVDRLNEEARRKGGYLTTRDIAELSHEFQQKTDALQQIFQQTLEQYVRARERAAFDHARRFPFDRVIVNTFAHLFDPERVRDEAEFSVTRRVLPGFFLAVDKMLGPELMESYQVRCRAIVERLSPGAESALDWEQVYADRETRDLCCDALVDMAPYFEDVEKRCEWFIGLVNGNLTAGEEWVMTDQAFYNLIDALFANLRQMLQDPMRKLDLAERHGQQATRALDATFKAMDATLRGWE
jgi:hypothetical protein